MRVFLTGATGFIGSAVRDRLRSRGHQMVALVRRADNARRLAAEGVETIVGDMCNPGGWTDAAAASDAIVHIAQVRFGKRAGMGWVREVARADRTAMAGLLAAAERGGRCKVFLYTSGVSAFGDHGDAWIDEETAGSPSPIGRYHLAGERLALEATKWGLPAVVLRPGLPYAPGGTFASFFLERAARGRFDFVGRGDNFVPCEHLDDLAEAYALALERPPIGRVVAVVDDEPLRMKEIGRLLLDAFDGGRLSGAPAWLAGLFAGRPLARMLGESYRVRNERAKRLLCWSPRYASLREGLAAVVAAYRAAARRG